MAMFEFGSNIALYLGMICVIAVLFFFIKRQITETENRLNNMMEVITGLSMEVVHLKTMVMSGPFVGGTRDITKLNETMIISDDEGNTGYEQDGEDDDNDSDESDEDESDEDESDEDESDEDESDEDEDDDEDDREEEVQVVKIEEDESIKVEVEEVEDVEESVEIVQKTVIIDLTSKLPPVVTDYNKFNMKKLKDFCIDKGISAEYSKLKKADLVNILEEFDAEQYDEEDSDSNNNVKTNHEEEDASDEEEDAADESEEEINLEEEIIVNADQLAELNLDNDEGDMNGEA